MSAVPVLEGTYDLFSHVLVGPLHAVCADSSQQVIIILIAYSANGSHIQKVSIWSYLEILKGKPVI